jgi:uncharacterized protein YcnI
MSYKLNKVAALVGIASMAAMMLPGVASAHGMLTIRSATLSTSVVDQTGTVAFQFNSSQAALLHNIKVEVCQTPTYTYVLPCTPPGNASLMGATLLSTGGQLGVSGWTIATTSASSAVITNAVGSSVTAGGTSNFSLAVFRNPSAYGTFYFRVTTYSGPIVVGTATNEVDFGAIGVSTAKSITVTGNVGETLTFEVGNEVNCTGVSTHIPDPNDTTEDLVTLTPEAMGLSQTSTGTAQFCIISNAQAGYVITYKDEGGYLGNGTRGFFNGSHEFSSADGVGNGVAGGTATLFASDPGLREQFGFNIVANTVPVVGANPVGDTTGVTLAPNYGTTNLFSYNDTGAAQLLASKGSPADNTIYTLAYVADITPLTPGGTYVAHQIFIATATF